MTEATLDDFILPLEAKGDHGVIPIQTCPQSGIWVSETPTCQCEFLMVVENEMGRSPTCFTKASQLVFLHLKGEQSIW